MITPTEIKKIALDLPLNLTGKSYGLNSVIICLWDCLSSKLKVNDWGLTNTGTLHSVIMTIYILEQ